MEKHLLHQVGTGEIHRDKTIAEWEYEITGTEEEIARLQRLIERSTQHPITVLSFARSLTPYPYHHDEDNDLYDNVLSSIYQTIHDLGDENVQEHIESMGILK